MMATRYPSLAQRKQAFKRSEARDAAVRAEVASWPDGLPPEEELPEITYAPGLLPDAPGFVHGIVQESPVWVIQCDGCGRVAVGQSRTVHGTRTNLVILSCGIHFGDTQRDPRRLCARCRVDAGWRDYNTEECRSDRRALEFYEGYMQEREPGLFDLEEERLRADITPSKKDRKMSDDLAMSAPICDPAKHQWSPHPTTSGLAVCVICGLLERTDAPKHTDSAEEKP